MMMTTTATTMTMALVMTMMKMLVAVVAVVAGWRVGTGCSLCDNYGCRNNNNTRGSISSFSPF